MEKMYKNERCLVFDESGNLGSDGKYFVIACIDTYDYKSVYNSMKRKIKQAKDLFPKLGEMHQYEIKAKDAYPCVKYHILETLNKKNIKIHYIVADLDWVKPILLKDKNIFYNFITKLLLDSIISDSDKNTVINIIMDNKTTKVTSKDSLFDYIKLYFNGDKDYEIEFNCMYKDSDASDAYVVQAADYVANAVYNQYEFGNSDYISQAPDVIGRVCRFPYSHFGMKKI